MGKSTYTNCVSQSSNFLVIEVPQSYVCAEEDEQYMSMSSFVSQ